MSPRCCWLASRRSGGSTFFLIRDVVLEMPPAGFLAVRFTIAAGTTWAVGQADKTNNPRVYRRPTPGWARSHNVRGGCAGLGGRNRSGRSSCRGPAPGIGPGRAPSSAGRGRVASATQRPLTSIVCLLADKRAPLPCPPQTRNPLPVPICRTNVVVADGRGWLV